MAVCHVALLVTKHSHCGITVKEQPSLVGCVQQIRNPPILCAKSGKIILFKRFTVGSQSQQSLLFSGVLQAEQRASGKPFQFEEECGRRIPEVEVNDQ